MKEQITKILDTFSAFWKAQEKKRKILYISVLGGVIVLAVVITLIANIKHYTVLFKGLESTDSAAMMTELATMGVEARLSDGGTTITVPESVENNARMQLGMLGYPKSPLNYELYNSSINMFSTEAEGKEQKRIQAQRRAEGTLKSLDNVENAIVTFAIPIQKDTVISVNAKVPTASVVVMLTDSDSLTDKQIKGMYNIIRTSIEGLVDDNITITDSSGNPLIAGEGKPEDVVAKERNKLRFKQEYEATINDSVTMLLKPMFGEAVNVTANAILNYDKTVGEKTEFTPSHDDGSGMVSQEDERNASGTDGRPGDVVGATPNADGTYPTDQGLVGGAYSDNEKSTTYLVNTAKTQVEKEGFKIDQLTISVATYVDLVNEEQKTELVTLVARAVGTDEASVAFVNMPRFGNTPDVSTSAFPFGMSRNMFFLLMAALLVMIIIFTVMYMGVSKKARRKRRAIEQQIYDAALAAGNAGQVDGFFNAEAGADFNNAVKIASLSGHGEEEANTMEAAVRKEIGEFAKNSPEIVGALLKSWLREEDEGGGGSRSGSRGSGRR